VLWDLHKSEKGPEGWARFVPIIPTHWYVYSLGSTVEYSFQNLEKGVDNQGLAWGHVEKNWGQTFPAGHVWLQAISADNTSQVFKKRPSPPSLINSDKETSQFTLNIFSCSCNHS
jgi:hypothetical protein